MGINGYAVGHQDSVSSCATARGNSQHGQPYITRGSYSDKLIFHLHPFLMSYIFKFRDKRGHAEFKLSCFICAAYFNIAVQRHDKNDSQRV